MSITVATSPATCATTMQQNALRSNILPYILGFRGPAQCFEIDSQAPMQIHLVPRNGGDTIVRPAWLSYTDCVASLQPCQAAHTTPHMHLSHV